jgi:hypothetical protein
MPPPVTDVIPRDTMPPTTPLPLRDVPPAGVPLTPPSATSVPDLNLLPTPAFDALGAAAPANFLPVSLQQPQASSRRTAHVPAMVPAETAPVAPPAMPPAQLPVAAAVPVPQPAPATRRLPQPTTMVTKTLCGEVIDSKTSRGYARIMFSEDFRPPVGTELQVYHQYVLGPEHQGSLVILDYEGALAVAGPRPWQQTKVSRGDTVECAIQVPELTPPPAPPEFVAAAERAVPVPAPTPAKASARPIAATPSPVPATGDHPVNESFARSVQKAAGNLRAEPTPAPSALSAARGPSPVYVAPGKIAPAGAAPVAPSSADFSPSVASAIGIPAAPADPLVPTAPQALPRRAEAMRTTALPVNFRQSVPAAGMSPTPAAQQAQWFAPIIERTQLERHAEAAAIASQVEEQFAPIVSAAEAAQNRK